MSGARSMEPCPVYIERAMGSHAFEIDGSQPLDCTLSFGVRLSRHGPEPVLEVLHERRELGRVCNTGPDSMMLAWRLMRAAAGSTEIGTFGGCSHAWHGYAHWNVRRPWTRLALFSAAQSQGDIGGVLRAHKPSVMGVMKMDTEQDVLTAPAR